jgi:hypothetical protein
MALIQVNSVRDINEISAYIEGDRLVCNNDVQSRQMKRLSPTTLALLLVISSLGHAFAAAFCPHASGRERCLAKAHSHTEALPSSHEVTAMPMDDRHGMHMDDMSMDGMVMPDSGTECSKMKSMSAISYLAVADDSSLANKVEKPVDICTHCLSHSGIFNAPISSVSVPDQSNKDPGSVPLPVSRFLVQAATTVAQIGSPRNHAPPGSSAPRYIVINVFLI